MIPFRPIHAKPGPVDGGLFNRVQDLIAKAFGVSVSSSDDSQDGGSGVLGIRNVVEAANIAALANLDASAFGGAGVAWVRTLQAAFLLARTTATAAALMIVPARGLPGWSWIRQIVRSPIWEARTTWSMDGTSGDDENNGAVGYPLKTNAELARRLHDAFAGNVTVTYLTSTTDVLRLQCIAVTLTLNGTQSIAQTKTVDAAQARTSAPAPGTANEITVAGFDWSPYVGFLLRVQGTGNYAVITKAPSLGVARLGELFNGSGTQASSTGVAAAAVVEIIDQTSGPGTISSAGTVTFSSINDLKFTGSRMRFSGKAVTPFVNRCVFRGIAAVIETATSINMFSCSHAEAGFSTQGEASDYNGCAFTGTGQFVFRNKLNNLRGAVFQGGAAPAIGDGSFAYFKGDLGVFDSSAGLLLAVGARANLQLSYYGSGNSAGAPGITLQQLAQVCYFTKPVMDAGLGVNTPAGNTAFAALPLAVNATYGTAAYGP